MSQDDMNRLVDTVHRMLATRGNRSTENFFGIVKALQKKTRTRLRVAVHSS